MRRDSAILSRGRRALPSDPPVREARRSARLLQRARVRGHLPAATTEPIRGRGVGRHCTHLSGIEGFDAATSYASVIITVPELEQLHASFKEGLRRGYGQVPINGIPRLLQPRRKAGTATGFSVVDVGGNWLRFYATGSSENEASRTGLGRVIDVAARQGDARGEEAQAIAVLDAGLQRYPQAPTVERDEALAYRAELEERTSPSSRGSSAERPPRAQ